VFLHSVDASGSADVPSVLQTIGEFDRQLMLVVVELYKWSSAHRQRRLELQREV
jgi:hypothetical protein